MREEIFYASGATNNIAVNASTDANGGSGVYGLNSSTGTGTQVGVSGSKAGNTGTGNGYGVQVRQQEQAIIISAESFNASGATTNSMQ